MPNAVTTNVDIGSFVLDRDEAEYADGLLTFAGADDFVPGTILARDSATGNYVLYVIGGVTNENGIPKAILAQEASADGAGDVAVRVLIKGTVARDRLVVDADGDASNLTDAILDELRDYTIVGHNVQQLAHLDNPAS